MSIRNRSGRARGLAAALTVACFGSLLVQQPSEAATHRTPNDLVAKVPSTKTPAVLQNSAGNAFVQAVAVIGDQVVLGGTFSQVKDPDGTVHTTRNLVVFKRTTGAVTRSVRVYGGVNALLRGPKKGTVYVAGSFSRINRTKVHNVALLDVRTGRVVRGFKAPTFNSAVLDLARVRSHLLVGGKFHRVGGHPQSSLVSLSATTGRNDHWVSLRFAGHHNWRAGSSTVSARIGISQMALDLAHHRLVIVGNFTKISGLSRDQIAVITLSGRHPAVSRTWATRALSATCNAAKWDSWVRDVAISPNGSYAVVVSAGGPRSKSPCDGAVRLELNTRSTHIASTWIASSGGDTLSAVAIGPKAVYVGGHMRWMNNNRGSAQAAPGAVPRASLAALDPKTGVPFSWNPGRHPRGIGVTTLVRTSKGLYIGSDTDFMGDEQYYRPRIAFLPLAGGTRIASTAAPKAPDVYQAGGSALGTGQVQRLHLSASGRVDYRWKALIDSGIDWSTVRGAFTTGPWLWTAEVGSGPAALVRRSFNGTSAGAPVTLEPWTDPVWSSQQTGSYGGQTYLGKPSSFVGDIPTLTAVTYSNGRLFYTVEGSTALHWRFFNPESGIVGDRDHVPAKVAVPVSTRGMFVIGNQLYISTGNGNLTRRTLSSSGTVARSGKTVSGPRIDKTDWSQGIVFAGRGPRPPA